MRRHWVMRVARIERTGAPNYRFDGRSTPMARRHMKKNSPASPTASTNRPAARATDSERAIRYAVVGLGYIAQVAILPAFANAKNSRLVALVSDDPVKLEELGRTYAVDVLVGYAGYAALLASGDVDAVFIALPNTMHAEYTIAAAQAGVHVLCEKPMATTARECEAMIAACAEADVKLMVAYRLHLEAGNLAAIELLQSGELGNPRLFSSDFAMQVRDADNIRLAAEMGGGTLWDIGIYCISASRYLFQEEPIAVSAFLARGEGARFTEVEEGATAILRYPNERLATFTCSFGAADVSSYRVIGTLGDVRVAPAYAHAEGIVHHVTIDGRTSVKRFAKSDQFAAELVHFSDCILEDREPTPSGTHGLNDVRIVEALYESARLGKAVKLELEEPAKRPSLDDEIVRPAVRKPELVHVNSPGESAEDE